jgi:hypothetical protein
MCQLEFIDEIGQENSRLHSKWESFIHMLSDYKGRLRTVITLPIGGSRYSKSVARTSQLNHDQIEPGDMVRIRSKDEVQKTLDRSARTHGCYFPPGMYNHCGKEYRVFKRVDHFFDEARGRMCKCNNLFLLEGPHCSTPNCDRSCLCFWHASWLQKV